ARDLGPRAARRGNQRLPQHREHDRGHAPVEVNRRRRTRALTAATVLVVAAMSFSVTNHPPPSEQPHTWRAGNTMPTRLGPTSLGETVGFDVILRLPHRAELDAFAQRVNDARTSDYRRYLSAVEIGDRFGAPRRVVAGLIASLR